MTRQDERLSEYRSKRNAGRTAERSGVRSEGTPGGETRFVVQRLDASNLHFDVRLEIDGALVSWAVPKGPSTDPRDKRLATRTEDHPLDYAGFEGRIAEDEYGAGTVVVWDTGTYRALGEHDPAEGLERGHLTVWLDGKKLTGGYAFTRAKLHGRDGWLMVKIDDEGADRHRKPARTQPESVLSGKRNEDL